MTAITVTNTEYEIAAALKTAFENARISGRKVWETVAVALSETDAVETQLRQNTPVAIIIYDDSPETLTTDNVPGLAVSFTLLFADRLHGDGDDATRLEAGMKLVNAAKNVVESDLPATTARPNFATAWGDDNYYQPQFDWGTPDISKPTDAERTPWVIAKLPVTIGAVITSQTAH